MSPFELGRSPTISAGIGLIAVLFTLLSGIGWAQDGTAELPADAVAEQTATPYPADLDDPCIDLDELELRLIPLTLDQIGPLAKAWQEQAQQVLEEVVASHPLVLKDPAPMIRVNELADSSVNFIVRPWTKTSDYWSTYWDLQRAVKEAFDANGISIPFPQTDMHLHLPDASKAAGPAALAALSVKDGSRPEVATSFATGDDGAAKPEEGGKDGGERG